MKQINRIARGIAGLLAATSALAAALPAGAADIAPIGQPVVPPSAPAQGWSYAVAPYLWAAGLEGDIGIFGRQPVHVDLSFEDIFDSLRFGGMVVAQAHNGTWGIFGDIVYVKTEADATVTRDVQGLPLTLDGNIEQSNLTATLMGEYRVVAEPTVIVDLMAGARIFSVDNDIELSLAAGGPPLAQFSGDDGSTWVDPIIGARARYDLTPKWNLTGWAMIGGFGAGSDVTWDALATVGYQWTDRFSLVAGYRALGVDYEDDGFVYDVIMQGPVLGAVFRF
jgi:hypothetical protein